MHFFFGFGIANRRRLQARNWRRSDNRTSNLPSPGTTLVRRHFKGFDEAGEQAGFPIVWSEVITAKKRLGFPREAFAESGV